MTADDSRARLVDENSRDADARWMGEALRLAEASVGLASPNPVVGCVLVRGGAIVGRGAHIYDNRDHAEIVALRQAGAVDAEQATGETAGGEQARGATAYVTLEPCSHTGRTGPCADALMKAGVDRVVVATEDPNPLVSGRGIGRLRAAGIAVTVGVLEEPARRLNLGFARFIRSQLPLVTLKAGLSLDGRIAPAQSPAPARAATTYLTSPASLATVQQMRHASDAILTGIGTVLSDDPLLSDRSGLARRRPLLRVILDTRLRLPLDSRLVASAAGDLLVYTEDAGSQAAAALRAAGVEVEQVARLAPQPGGSHAEEVVGLDLHAILASLGRRGILNLLVEGGSRLNRAWLAEGLVDQLRLFYAPIFLGERGVPLVAGSASLRLKLEHATLTPAGEDVSFEACLRDPWR